MSELTNARKVDLLRGLLTSVSTLALLTFIGTQDMAVAADDDGDHPVVWVELGGQLEKQTGQGDGYVPDFVTNNASAPAISGIDFLSQRGANFSNGAEGKLSFEPADSNWVFSASILYGRSNGQKNIQNKPPGPKLHFKTLYVTQTKTPGGYNRYHFHCCSTGTYTPEFQEPYANLRSRFDQSHMIVDFQAGKDFGLGMFGNKSSSVISAGVRFAQFTSRASSAIQAFPVHDHVKQYHHYAGYSYYRYATVFPTHRYMMTENDSRSFMGIGPAISWNASSPLIGNPQRAEIDFDWGANAAVLFGRQRVAGTHQTTSITNLNYSGNIIQTQHTGKIGRVRTVTVPNVGGFAGISFRYADAKVSFGYRGDFFFGAMDVGNQARKTETAGFYGPFATVSVGLGG
jgi:hypothetical protein